MTIEQDKLKNIIEAALFSVGKPMSVDQLQKLFSDEQQPSANAIREMLRMLQNDSDGRGVELKEVASGFRYQARQNYSEWLSRLWEERPAKYSRAALETLALIAYRQPVTRGEIENVRGVGVSSSIIKTMLEREWIRIVGHRDVPGRPALYATTKQFLDYFNMKSLEDLPSLAEIKDIEDINPELDLPNPDKNDDYDPKIEMAVGESDSVDVPSEGNTGKGGTDKNGTAKNSTDGNDTNDESIPETDIGQDQELEQEQDSIIDELSENILSEQEQSVGSELEPNEESKFKEEDVGFYQSEEE